MITTILGGLGLVLILFLISVAFRPADYRVERRRAIAAPPGVLWAEVNDHRKFNQWNPFLKLDPNVKNTITGPDTGVGSVCAWEGNDKVGAGSATIVESKPGELVRLRMDWKRPMQGTSTAEFTFAVEGANTVVTWAMYGKNGYMAKLVILFMKCDDMIGSKFAEGLAELDRTVTSAATVAEAR